MAFEPPSSASHTQLRAVNLATTSTPYLLKGLEDPDAEWNLVTRRPVATLMPAPDGGFLPQEVTATYDDGSVRMFDPEQWVLIGPVTERLGGDRQQIAEVAEAHGFQVVPGETTVRYARGLFEVEVHYDDDDAVLATRARAGQLIGMAISGKGAKAAAISWLQTNQPDQA